MPRKQAGAKWRIYERRSRVGRFMEKRTREPKWQLHASYDTEKAVNQAFETLNTRFPPYENGGYYKRFKIVSPGETA